jgi:hypothetical protein
MYRGVGAGGWQGFVPEGEGEEGQQAEGQQPDGTALYRGVGTTTPAAAAAARAAVEGAVQGAAVAAAAAGTAAAMRAATGAAGRAAIAAAAAARAVHAAAATATATLHASATIIGTGLGMSACVAFTLSTPFGEAIAYSPPAPLSVPAQGEATATVSLTNLRVRIWTARQPVLYIVRAEVRASADGKCKAAGKEAAVDSVSVEHGFRSLRFDADEGFFLNEQSFKVRERGEGGEGRGRAVRMGSARRRGRSRRWTVWK